MARPLIGITSRSTGGPTRLTGASRTYLLALEAAGAAPVILPLGLAEQSWRELFARVDGLLLPGGGDISAQGLRSSPTPKITGVDDERDGLELTLARWAAQEAKPLLGICRGAQVLNVALGGTLYMDLASQCPGALLHDAPEGTPRDRGSHSVRLEPGSRLRQVLGASELMVNSFHHQAVREVAPGLRASAHAADGVIEGLEMEAHPFAMAVQWHPEEMPEDPAMRRLFERFVAACAARPAKRP